MSMFERIELLRKERGISQGKLEKELGFSNGSISKWKLSTPNPERLKKLAEYFGVSFDYLITGEESNKEDKRYYINKDTEKVAQEIFDNDRLLFDVYRSTQKDRLMAYARFLDEERKKEEGF